MLTVFATEVSEIYGHGRRLVIWFSGCTLCCKGCINEYLWDRAVGKETTVDEIFDIIKSAHSIIGVTYIGGEPLQQGEDLLGLSEMVITAGLDIVLFTGYEFDELDTLQRKIADKAVVVIHGRYDETKRDTYLIHRGSHNQTITINDQRLRSQYLDECRQVEVEITEDSEKYFGFLDDFINGVNVQ
jgi:anaerobic ribonucleoside-triphosphate reductase activating protein